MENIDMISKVLYNISMIKYTQDIHLQSSHPEHVSEAAGAEVQA